MLVSLQTGSAIGQSSFSEYILSDYPNVCQLQKKFLLGRQKHPVITTLAYATPRPLRHIFCGTN